MKLYMQGVKSEDKCGCTGRSLTQQVWTYHEDVGQLGSAAAEGPEVGDERGQLAVNVTQQQLRPQADHGCVTRGEEAIGR